VSPAATPNMPHHCHLRGPRVGGRKHTDTQARVTDWARDTRREHDAQQPRARGSAEVPWATSYKRSLRTLARAGSPA
jgi:hypothetical protein